MYSYECMYLYMYVRMHICVRVCITDFLTSTSLAATLYYTMYKVAGIAERTLDTVAPVYVRCDIHFRAAVPCSEGP
jgi:hypothetical protein